MLGLLKLQVLELLVVLVRVVAEICRMVLVLEILAHQVVLEILAHQVVLLILLHLLQGNQI